MRGVPSLPVALLADDPAWPQAPDLPHFRTEVVGTPERGSQPRNEVMRQGQPLSSSTSRATHLVVSTHGSAEAVTRRIEEALLGLDPNLRPAARRVREAVDRELELPAAVAAIAGLLSLTAVTLAAIGLFGVTAFVVNQRRHEVSVRMALGATGTAIVGMLLRDSLRPVIVGMLCGRALAMLVGQVISRVLYGVSGHDPIAIFTAVLVLAATAVGAVLFAARPAARVSPAGVRPGSDGRLTPV